MKGYTRKQVVLAILCGVVIGSAVVGTGYALTSKGFTYSHTKTGYLSLHASDFAPDNISDTTQDYYNYWDASQLVNPDSSRCFNAGVHLPQGAIIKSIRFWYQSNASSDFYGELNRVDFATHTYRALGSVTPVDDSNTLTSASSSVPPKKAKVNNQAYMYAVGVCPSDGTDFDGARITYTYTSAGD
jgi:hypothetical protein